MKKLTTVATILILFMIFNPVYAMNVSYPDDLPYSIGKEGFQLTDGSVWNSGDHINFTWGYQDESGEFIWITTNVHFEGNGTPYESYIGTNFLPFNAIKSLPTETNIYITWIQFSKYNEHFNNEKEPILIYVPTIPDTGIADDAPPIIGLSITAGILFLVLSFTVRYKHDYSKY